MSAKDITDNILSAIDSLKKIVPGGWSNVKSIFVRTEKSVSLPIYTSLVHEEWEQSEETEIVIDNSDIKKSKLLSYSLMSGRLYWSLIKRIKI